jgi:hypothetical protein
MIETPRILLDARERASQLRLPEYLSGLVEVAIALEDAARFGKLGKHGIVKHGCFSCAEDVAFSAN